MLMPTAMARVVVAKREFVRDLRAIIAAHANLTCHRVSEAQISPFAWNRAARAILRYLETSLPDGRCDGLPGKEFFA